ncbi:ABC transporter permease [uncultured Microbacterium sp.]|uniref:ABC transporter permease n=1 Tax=uncultured Microbacterium sp. TaxID=191216 RepID=UPI0035CB945A
MTAGSALAPRTRFSGLRIGSGLYWFAVIVLVLVVAGAILAPFIAPYDPDALDLANPYAGPSPVHWLGTDASGRDTLSRLLYGGRISLTGPAVTVVITTVVGMLLGLVAAWIGGPVDWVLTRIFDILFSFPGLLLAILFVAIFGAGGVSPVIAMCIAYIPYVARLVRSLVLSERSRPYVAAYRVQGFSGPWVALRRVLPNVSPTVLGQSGLNFGYVLMDLAALSFLGIGVQPPTSDWGSMVRDGAAGVLSGHPLPSLVPAVAVVVVVVCVNIVGQEFADRISGGKRA